MKKKSSEKIKKLAMASILAALCYVGYAIFPAISVTGTKVHLGNAFVILGALLIGPIWGGMAGAVGLTLADILGGFAASAPRTFICKLLMGLIIGLVSHKIAKINRKHKWNYITGWVIVSTIIGVGFNCIFEPVLKYIWYTVLTPDASKAESAVKAMVAVTSVTTVINAAINSVIGIIFYLALRPILLKSGILILEPGDAMEESGKEEAGKEETGNNETEKKDAKE